MNTRISQVLLLAIIMLTSGSQWMCNRSKEENGGNAAADRFASELFVKTMAVTSREWISTAPISGNLRSLSVVEIKPEVGGRLIAVHFKEGDLVLKNQLLAEIDTINYRLTYEQAEAALAVAQAGLDRAKISAEYAKTEMARAENLLRTGGITQKDHQAAVTAVKEADSQVRLAAAQCGQSRAALAIAEKTIKDCRIFAPAQGHVQKRYFDQGSLLSPGVPLCTLVDNSQLELECVIPSHQLAAIRLGQRAVFTTPTWGDRKFEGAVSAINPVIESDNRSVKLLLKLSNPGGELRSGMYARGQITTGRESNAIVVPRDSLIPEKEGTGSAAVYVVKNGKAHRVLIQMGGAQEDQVWVRTGLVHGDIIITEIGPSLKEGVAVQVMK